LQEKELAEKVAYLLLERGHLYDEDIELEFDVDEFEVIKAKNLLCRYYGIAVEKWHRDGNENRMALFLQENFSGPEGKELIHRVFHDPRFKTKRRLREEERKAEIRKEVREIFEHLREEWGDLLPGEDKDSPS
jgi:transcription initiation factor IIE alpha subunit